MNKMLARIGSALKALTVRFPGASGWVSLFTWGGSQRDYAADVKNGGADNAIVSACVRWMARTLPEAPLTVMQRNADGELQAAPEHPLQALLERPNAFYSGLDLLAATISDWTFGDAYWVKIRSGAGRPVELWWVPSWTMAPMWPDDGSEFISHYEQTVDGQKVRWEVADVVHLRNGTDPRNIRQGLGLKALFREIATDDHAATWTAALLANMGIPGVVISPEGDTVPSQSDLEAAKNNFMSKFGGDKRGEPLVMAGPTKVSVLSFNPQQMDLKALRRIPEERITAYLGIPAIVVGLGAGLDRSTFANFAEAREAAYESCLLPIQRLFAAGLQAQLVPDFGDPARLRVQFDLEQVRVLQDDQNALHERARADLLGGLLTLNQALTMIGEEPVDGEGGDVRYVPNTVTVKTLDTLIPEAQPASLTAPTPLRALPLPTVDEAAAGKGALPSTLKAAALSDDDLLARYEAGLATATEDLADDLLGAFEAMIDTVAGRAMSHLKQAQKAHSAHLEHVTDPQFDCWCVEAKAVADVIAGLVTDADHAEIRSLLRSGVLKGMRQAAEDLSPLLETPVRITRASPAYKAAVAEMETRLPGMIETTGADFSRLVARLERRPGSVPIADVRAALTEYIADTYPGRAEAIARTELGYAHAAGVLTVAEKSGLASRVAIHDGTDDGPCKERNGTTATLEEARGIGLLHTNCQLRLIPVLAA